MTWDEWEDTYLPTTPLAYDSQEDIPADVPFDRIWTMIDGDGIYTHLTSGVHVINRLGYMVSDVPWTDDVFVTNDKRMYA